MNYAQTIEYLFSRLPVFSRIGAAAYKADLVNITRLCEELGNPQNKFKSIHVAGTNGKGSTSHMLASILQEAGYKTGLHTSPHLRDFRERIKVNGEMADEQFVIDFTDKIRPLIEEIEPSFFEISVAMAFQYFALRAVDFAVIETGLGGRLDSTNIIIPEVSVITNIGWDHMNFLGDTLGKIAAEKAGIIKPGIPVIIGEVLRETEPIFAQKAKELKAPLSVASHKRQALEWKWQHHHLIVEVATNGKADHQRYELDLPGIYQTRNLLTVLETCAVLHERGLEVNEAAMHAGLKRVKRNTGLHGRWEIIHEHPLTVLDVAHNEAGIRQLIQQLEVTDHHELHIVLGMVKDKEIDKVLALLPATAHYYFTQAGIPRALAVEELAQRAGEYDLRGRIYTDVNKALKDAHDRANSNDLILVCGSVFLVAEVGVFDS